MNARYSLLAQRIEQETAELSRTVAVIQDHWRKGEAGPMDPDAYLNSVVLNLHGFYSGLERIFELVAVEMDGGTLGGESWHAELLRQMTFAVPSVRPAVLQPATATALDEYRRFRHRVRNIYATKLDPARVKPLATDLPGLWRQLQHELGQFVTFLSGA